MGDDYASKGTAAEYGSYGASDSYGYEKIVDCNSALGLIGLLGLIELLRDIIDNVIKQSEKKDMRRRRRGAGIITSGDFLVGFFSGGGASDLLQTLPATILPLLQNMVDVNDGFEPPACLERSVCEANQAFLSGASNTSRSDTIGGTVGGLVSSLLTQVASKSLTSGRETYLKALRAGEVGRNGGDCRKAFIDCPELKPRYRPRPGLKVKALVYDHLTQ